MRKFMIGICFLVLCITATALFPLHEKWESTQVRRVEVENDYKYQQIMLDVLRSRKDNPLLKSAHYYAELMSRIKSDAQSYAFKVQIQIIDDQNTKMSFTKDKYEGIKKIPIKVVFFQVDDREEMLRIFKYLEQWQDELPLAFTSFAFKDNNIQVIGGIYGV